MNKRLLIICLTFISIISFGQGDFQHGYIITLDNDTIFGLIEYGVSRKFNFSVCRFKANETDIYKEYYPDEIKAYRFSDNKYYVSKELPINNSSKMVFVEYLVDGVINLYFYVENLDEKYIIEKEDKSIYILEDEFKTVVGNGTKYQITSNKFRGILKYALSDCSELNSSINTVNLTQKSMINLSKKYHEFTCSTGEECITFEKPKNQYFNFGVYFSYNIIYFKVNTDAYGYPPRDLANDNAPGIGLVIEFIPAFWNSKFALNFLSEYYSATYKEKLRNDAHSYYTYGHIKTLNWNNSVLFKYIYPSTKFRPVLIAGLSCSYQKALDYIYNDVTLPISPVMYGPEIGTGIDYYINNCFCTFLILTYSYQSGVYNYFNYLRFKMGLKF